MRALLLLALLAPAIASAFTVDVLRQTGPTSKRIDVVILGDGYRTQDQAQLTTDANALLSSLFNATPWKEYQGLFNVRLVHVVSNENGADNGTYGASRDTALGAYFGCSGVDRLLCIENSKAYPILSSHTPDYDLAIIVVNDPKYGGSGGSIPVTSTNASSGEIVVHELGHSIAGLADEYESAFPGYPSCGTDCSEANATKNATSTVKWKAWIPSSTPIPTPENNASYSSAIGVFEGARYMTSGVYRPKDSTCKMRSLGQPNCSVCAEQLVKSFWNRVPSLFDAKSPDVANVTGVCGDVTFSVVPLSVQMPAYQYAWYVDDVVQSATGNSFTFTPTSSTSTVKVVARDNTALVRNDPNAILEDTASWTVQGGTTGCPVGICDVAAMCVGDGGCDRTYRMSGEECGTPTCSNGAKSWIGTCDGAGACTGPAGSQSCGAYSCNDAGVDCRTQCRFNADCLGGFVCVNEECVLPAGVDAGVVDAGAPDAGTVKPDAGAPDSGTAGFDAGTGTDAGVVTGPPPRVLPNANTTVSPAASTGCGCSGGAGGVAPFALLGLGLLVSRRRTRTAPLE